MRAGLCGFEAYEETVRSLNSLICRDDGFYAGVALSAVVDKREDPSTQAENPDDEAQCLKHKGLW